MDTAFVPSPEADPYDYIDSDLVPPVPNLYLPKVQAVRMVPSDRIITATYPLTAAPTNILGRAEQGVASKVTISVFQTGANVAVAPSQEQLLNVANGVTIGSYIAGAFMIPAAIGAAGVAQGLVICTTDELWACAVLANAVSVSWISVLIEQFYGD